MWVVLGLLPMAACRLGAQVSPGTGVAEPGLGPRLAARSILALSSEAAARGVPCALTGVVTCSSSDGDLLFIQDESGGVYVYHPRDLPAHSRRVRVLGRTGQGLFSPIVLSDSIDDLGPAPLPRALPVSVEQLASGRHDSQWVEVEGVVLRSEMNWGQLTLLLASGSARLEARVLEVKPGQETDWTDARVRIRGVAGTAYNNRRQLVGFHLLSQSTNLIEVLRAPVADPFAAPLRASSALMAYSPEGGSEHRVRLRGVVAWVQPGQPFALRDEAGGVRVLTRGASADGLRPGDLVEAAGFAAPTLNQPVLQEAVVRVVGRSDVPVARSVAPRDAASGLHENERVILEADVLQAGERHGNHAAAVVEAQGLVFRVRYPQDWGLGRGSDLVGCKVRVTGLCRLDAGQSSMPGAFSVWLQERADLEVLHRSRWWWQRLSLVILSSLVGVVLLGTAWLFLLRRQVRRQTAALRARESVLERRFEDLFQNSNDIILELDLEGRLTSINAAGEALLGLSRDRLDGIRFESLVEPADVPVFRALRRSLLEGHPRTSHELRIQGRDARGLVIEVTPRLQYEAGEVKGIQAIAKDVTARRAAEDALRAGEQQLRASLRERERLGRSLHDSIIQSIYAVGLRIEGCRHTLQAAPSQAEECLAGITTELNRVIREVRQFISGLEQHPISGSEFKAAVEALSVTYGGGSRPVIRMNLDDFAARSLSPLQATELLDLVREAVSNAVRHADASNVAVSCTRSGAAVHLEITDDGVGFEPESVAIRGSGLRNMATRADRVGAGFHLQSSPGRGTRILVKLPIPQSSHE